MASSSPITGTTVRNCKTGLLDGVVKSSRRYLEAKKQIRDNVTAAFRNTRATRSSPCSRTRGHCWHPPKIVLHLKPSAALAHVSGLAISGVRIVVAGGVRVAAASASVVAAVHVAAAGARLLEVEALLELRHHVGHGGPLRRGLRGALERDVRGLPHAVDIVVAAHARVHDALDVAPREALPSPVDDARRLRVAQDGRPPSDQLQQHDAEAVHVALRRRLHRRVCVAVGILWVDVSRCANECVCGYVSLVVAVESLGQAKIGDLGFQFGLDSDLGAILQEPIVDRAEASLTQNALEVIRDRLQLLVREPAVLKLQRALHACWRMAPRRLVLRLHGVDEAEDHCHCCNDHDQNYGNSND
ncbi:hypothetical protein U9M48_044652 [Paspalum notatum var. saurae]|uniref:Uncharacterized protein n=1 Tax=Paspalum notatum var. saurae TaxID=547442 RepID=A0AAQ3UW47_PASNO